MSTGPNPMPSEPAANLPRMQVVLGILALAAIVMVVYFTILNVGFYGDDWIFYELAGRLGLGEYLSKYWDPNLQTAWYRPVQGMLFRIGYTAFGANQIPYHLVNVLFHLANCVVLFVMIGERTRRWVVAFVAALLFATMPVAAEAVFWAGVIDPVTTFFSLLTLWFWLRYLERESRLDYALAFASFLVALLSKEIAALLPVTLFLFDRMAVGKSDSLRALASRYAPFIIAWALYAPVELVVVRRSVFLSREGYQPGLNALTNLWSYFGALAFPWGYHALLSSIWRMVVVAALLFAIVIRRYYIVIPIVAGAILTILPVAAFPQPAFRFLYMPLTASAFLAAMVVDHAWQRWHTNISSRLLLLFAVVGIVVFGGVQVAGAAANYGEFGRVSRVPFRNFRQAHPTLEPDTLVYYIDPPVPGTNLSGMFFWFYGKDVVGMADDSGRRAGLREHSAAYVSYFDAGGNQKEQRVEKESSAKADVATPVDLAVPMRLEGWELVNSTVKMGEPFILLLYWRGLAPMETDYIVSVDLKDSMGRAMQNWSKSPRRGKAPTSAWVIGELVVDAVQVTVPDPAIGQPLHLELAVLDPSNRQRVPLLGAGKDTVTIQPLSVVQ